MSILVSCDACGRELRAKDEAAGKQARCPNCKGIVQIPHAEEFALAEEIGGTRPESPVDQFSDDREPCPACGEMNASSARQCQHCDEDLLEGAPRRKKPRRSSRSSRRQEGEYPTADLGKRLLGKLIDGFAGLLSVLPGGALLIAGAVSKNGQGDGQMILAGVVLMLFGMLILFAVNIYLLVTRSQTIGKWLDNTKIMDYETHEPAGFVKTFILRRCVNGLLELFVPFYGLVDICVIFGEEHRCLHDQIAGTYVVDIS